MWSEIKRKFFHLSGLIYLVGLVWLPRPIYLGLLVSLWGLVLAAELTRLKNPQVHHWFAHRFGGLFRPDEQFKFTGVFWMLGGVIITVGVLKSIQLAAAAILYLILGDGIASLVGLRFGGPALPGSRKRWSGSAACFLMCVFVGAVLLRSQFGWPVVLIGALVATAAEAGRWSVNDNFLIPVASALALWACSRVG